MYDNVRHARRMSRIHGAHPEIEAYLLLRQSDRHLFRTLPFLTQNSKQRKNKSPQSKKKIALASKVVPAASLLFLGVCG